jgi:hypothetical protein
VKGCQCKVKEDLRGLAQAGPPEEDRQEAVLDGSPLPMEGKHPTRGCYTCATRLRIIAEILLGS